jgi:hypothetical protein
MTSRGSSVVKASGGRSVALDLETLVDNPGPLVAPAGAWG